MDIVPTCSLAISFVFSASFSARSHPAISVVPKGGFFSSLFAWVIGCGRDSLVTLLYYGMKQKTNKQTKRLLYYFLCLLPLLLSLGGEGMHTCSITT
jgi:hypothetical protein